MVNKVYWFTRIYFLNKHGEPEQSEPIPGKLSKATCLNICHTKEWEYTGHQIFNKLYSMEDTDFIKYAQSSY